LSPNCNNNYFKKKVEQIKERALLKALEESGDDGRIKKE